MSNNPTVTISLEQYLKLANSDVLAENEKLKKELEDVISLRKREKSELNKTISGLRNNEFYLQKKITDLTERNKFLTTEANKCFNLHKESEDKAESWKQIAESATTKLRNLRAKNKAKK